MKNNLKIRTMTIKVYKIRESGRSLIKLPEGTYEISFNGKTTCVSHHGHYNSTKEIEVDGVDEIRKIQEHSVRSHFEDSEGNKLSVEEFEQKKSELIKNANICEFEHYGLEFENLEEEFEFKKFMRTWNPIQRLSIVKSDPLPLERINVQFRTDNPFIVSGLSYTWEDPSIFYFDRLKAAHQIVRDTFEELEMEFKPNLDYRSTNGEKVWSNSDHSGIRYVVAFNTYVFDDTFRYDEKSRSRGSLEDLKKEYENLKKRIRDRIISKYKFHFKTISDRVALELLDESLNSLKTVQKCFSEMDYKVKDRDRYFRISKTLRNAIEKIENTVTESV